MSVASISVATDLHRRIDVGASAGGNADTPDHVRDVLRRNQDDHAAQLDRAGSLIDEGLASAPIDATPEVVLEQVIAGISFAHG